MYKNTKHTVEIEAMGTNGEGIARIDGYTVFVPFAVSGDIAEILIVKENKSFGYAKLLKLISPSEKRVNPTCSVFGKCGGCDLQHISQSAQTDFKREKVQSAVSRIGGFSDVVVNPTVSGQKPLGYRNKAQFPASNENGALIYGFFAPRSHHVVKCENCILQDERSNDIAAFITEWADKYGVSAYDEESGKGCIRHICVRVGSESAVVVLVINERIRCIEDLAADLIQKFPYITGVIENRNTKQTNAIYGEHDRVIYGVPYIFDCIGKIRYKIHYKSFYQVNPYTTRLLYEKVRELCGDAHNKTIFDLYCGAGTIGLFVADCAKKVIGIELVREAVENARENAAINNIENAAFYCGAAEKTAPQLIEQGEQADIVILDPPRKGCDNALLDAIGKMNPAKIIYVSCDCATMARDAAIMRNYGYTITEVTPFDQFPQTCHVETVVCLSRKRPDDKIEIDLNLDEVDITSAESKATYDEIKAYVLEKYALKVSGLYISQVKRKLGLDVGKNYNLPKSENPTVPTCPPEKETAITEALRHFGMIN